MAKANRKTRGPDVGGGTPPPTHGWVIVNLLLLTVLLLGTLTTAWLVFRPHEDILEFLAAWKVVAPVTGVLTFIAAIWALVLGKDPKATVLQHARDWLALRVLGHQRLLICVAAAQALLSIGLAAIWLHLHAPLPEHLRLVLAGEFDRADGAIKAATDAVCPDDSTEGDAFAAVTPANARFACAVNEAAFQRSRIRNRAANKNRCSEVAPLLAESEWWRDSLWSRYLRHIGIAACLNVSEQPKLAVEELSKARKVASRIVIANPGREYAEAQAAIAIAASYLDNKAELFGMKDNQDRLNLALANVQKVPKAKKDDDDSLMLSIISRRMLGGIAYERGDSTAASLAYREAIDDVPTDRAGPYSGFHLERVRLSNNIGFMQVQSGQTRDALNTYRSALEKARGLDSEVNSQRREKIRLLSNMALALSDLDQCNEAARLAEERAATQKEVSVQCPALLDLSVLSCSIKASRQPALYKAKFLGKMACALSPKDCNDAVATRVDDVAKAMTALGAAFKGCYAPFEFPIDRIKFSLQAIQ